MKLHETTAAFLASMLVLAATTSRGQDSAENQPAMNPAAVQVPPPENEGQPPAEKGEANRTPPRLAFVDGQVSFWRPGAKDWAPAKVNTALAPGDSLYTGPAANLEIQIGARAYLRAGENTQLRLANQEPDFMQVEVTAGHASFDLRSLPAGQTVEVDTPNAAFTIDKTGYYRVDVGADHSTFITRRGGRAMMSPAGAQTVAVAPSEEVVIEGTDQPQVETYVAPEVDAWDRWNYDRTDQLIDALSSRYVSPGVYGADSLDQNGDWRVVQPYGPVWVPDNVPPDWAPYSDGVWTTDPYYGWTWVDNAPWGWAPYHYGRWVYVNNYWGWAPGPLVPAPVYSPALVAFFGAGFGVGVGFGFPTVGWVALGWGEPLVPWWGRAGFIGVPCWRGWWGPHVVNNVVINRNTVVNINNINVFRNTTVPHGIVAAPADRFGQGAIRHVQLSQGELNRMTPFHGALPIKPTSASLVGSTTGGARPPAAVASRQVVATRMPSDPSAHLKAQGLEAPHQAQGSAPRIVSAPARQQSASSVPARPPFGHSDAPERARPPMPPKFDATRGTIGEAPTRPGTYSQITRQAPGAGARPMPPQFQAPVQRPLPPARSLPGEPANRVFQGQPAPVMHQAPAPRVAAPPMVRSNAGAAGARSSGGGHSGGRH